MSIFNILDVPKMGGTAILIALSAYGLHSCSVDGYKTKIEDLRAAHKIEINNQIAADVKNCNAQKEISERAGNDFQIKLDDNIGKFDAYDRMLQSRDSATGTPSVPAGTSVTTVQASTDGQRNGQSCERKRLSLAKKYDDCKFQVNGLIDFTNEIYEQNNQ